MFYNPNMFLDKVTDFYNNFVNILIKIIRYKNYFVKLKNLHTVYKNDY